MTQALPNAYGIAGVVLDGSRSAEPTTLWIADGKIVDDQPAGAEILAKDVWVMPGLVDAHCHIGLDADGGVDEQTTEQQAITDRDTGVLLVRDTGVPVDTHWIDERVDLPRIIRSGRHIARPKRYIRNFAVEIEPEELPAEAARQAERGDGWVKIVGDWIDREIGDLAPLWTPEQVHDAIAAVHEKGARVQVHTFCEEAVADWVNAGVDCVEHGTGLDGALIDQMATKNIALVPTLINLDNFPKYAAQGEAKFPIYSAHMMALHARRLETIGKAREAGVQVYCGTDAGGVVEHGRVADEIESLTRLGGAEFALGAASWRARQWLGAGGLATGDSADFIVLEADPRQDVSTLRRPKLVVLRGAAVH